MLLMWSMLGTLEWGQGMVFPALCVAGVVHAGHPGMGAGHGLSLNCLSSVWLAEGYIIGVHICAFSICIYSYIIFVLFICPVLMFT